MGKRLRPGDVLEVNGQSGLVYLQFLGEHPEYGDAVSVCPFEQPSRPSGYEALFISAYVIFYPLRAALARGLANVVGHVDSKGVPKKLRRPGARVGLSIMTWVVENGNSEITKQRLTEDELQLPIAAIWNHELLLQRVHDGWRPDKEGA